MSRAGFGISPIGRLSSWSSMSRSCHEIDLDDLARNVDPHRSSWLASIQASLREQGPGGEQRPAAAGICNILPAAARSLDRAFAKPRPLALGTTNEVR